MRISTIQAFNTGVLGIQNNYSNVTRTQEQISSGKRILSPADDPVGSVRLLQLDQQANKLDQYKANLTAATNSLTQEEATLNSVNNLLQRVREIALEAGNGALSRTDRQALAQELAEREEELLGLANAQNARGEFLFGGFSGSAEPFVKQPDGSYRYKGDEGQRLIQIGPSKQIALNDNGKSLFADISNVNRVSTSPSPNAGATGISLATVTNDREFEEKFLPGHTITISVSADGATYSLQSEGAVLTDDEGNDMIFPVTQGSDSHSVRVFGVLATIDGPLDPDASFTIRRDPVSAEQSQKRGVLDTVRILREELEAGGDSREAKLRRRDVLSISLQNLDNAMNKVLGVQTSIGARLNVIESTENEHGEAEVINAAVKSGIEDLDYAEALSRLSLQTVVLQAAQQSFVKVSGLSLFNLLR